MKFHCRVMGLSHPLAVNPVISLETAGLWANLGRKCKKSMFPEFISFDNPIRRVQSEARQYAASLTHTKLIKGFDSYLLHIFSPWQLFPQCGFSRSYFVTRRSLTDQGGLSQASRKADLPEATWYRIQVVTVHIWSVRRYNSLTS